MLASPYPINCEDLQIRAVYSLALGSSTSNFLPLYQLRTHRDSAPALISYLQMFSVYSLLVGSEYVKFPHLASFCEKTR